MLSARTWNLISLPDSNCIVRSTVSGVRHLTGMNLQAHPLGLLLSTLSWKTFKEHDFWCGKCYTFVVSVLWRNMILPALDYFNLFFIVTTTGKVVTSDLHCWLLGAALLYWTVLTTCKSFPTQHCLHDLGNILYCSRYALPTIWAN